MITEKDYPSPPEYIEFKRRVKELTGVDLDTYKYQIHRRVHMLMQRWKVESYVEYFKIINESDQKLRDFLDYLTINVSEFFRNPQRFEQLQNEIVPQLLASSKHSDKGGKHLKVWSAGCATGEEPYTLAILLNDTNITPPPPVLATDIDRGAIAFAEKGLYLDKQLLNVSKERVQKYFSPSGANKFAIKEEIKQKVKFQRQDMTKEKFDTGFDLILCRNVVIYFRPETKDQLYLKFVEALRPGGVLMVGSTEQIFNYRKIGLKNIAPFFYQRAE